MGYGMNDLDMMAVDRSHASGAGNFARTFAHAVGNVFIGLSIGLAIYYGLTNLVTHLDQLELRKDFTEAGGHPGPDRVVEGSVLDFEGWKERDVAYWNAIEEGEVFGRLIIEHIGLDALVVKGHSRAVLKKGPGWIDYTDLPGPVGNCGIAGHRTTYGAPFRRVGELEPGDTVDLYSPFRRYRYRVFDITRVTPDRVDVMDSTSEPQLTLSACDPPYSARYRLIIRAKLVGVSQLSEGP